MRHKYKPGDIVLIRSAAGPAIPAVHVRLVKRIEVKPSKGRTMDWPGYVLWDAVLIKESEVKMLKKKFQIPYAFPDDVATSVFESNIIKKVRATKKNKK